MTTTQQENLVDAIVTDHREVQALFAEIEACTDPDTRRGLVEHVITQLVRHAVAEEQYLYPTARKVLPDGDAIADHEIAEHIEAEEAMKALENTDVRDPEFDRLVRELIKDVTHHLQEEETDLLPKLQAVCDNDELRELGRKFEQSKKMAPTRPHPSAPHTPPANKILGPGLGLIDRMRTTMSGRDF